ncbi:hypothetical protein LSH36_5g01035 [Paralvinella palmiformis]|uniref:BHLH domain-containing protein n=1 Tax=Paralvinella palmiformis TaxID=53620 RepID=A0AAD9NGZ8_9ANNE|nr:hypothetical protein LSH36_5g01035 [Paralvinella palmiformis]
MCGDPRIRHNGRVRAGMIFTERNSGTRWSTLRRRKHNENIVRLFVGRRLPVTTKLTREERRRRRRATQKYRTAHASRERVRVEAFNIAFNDLRQLLPTLPPNKKLSKIEILRLAICYISYLSHILDMGV